MKTEINVSKTFIGILLLIPFIYLGFIWKQIPKSIPLHIDSIGNTTSYINKVVLLLFPIFFPFLTHLLFGLVTKFDKESNYKKVGNKFRKFKLSMVLTMSLISCTIIHIYTNHLSYGPRLLIIAIGLLYTIFGNFCPILKYGWFIGIRTPWTLLNESVWIWTHQRLGIYWVLGGVLIIFCGILMNLAAYQILFLAVTISLLLLSFIYSYIVYRNKRLQY